MFSGAVKLPETFWQTTFGITAGLGAFGVAAHYIAVFGYRLILPKNWEDRKLKEFMDKENNNKI